MAASGRRLTPTSRPGPRLTRFRARAAIGHLTPPDPLQKELAALGTAATLVITPDNAAAAVMGTNLLDAAIAAPALEAGLTQAMSCAEPAQTLWSAI